MTRQSAEIIAREMGGNAVFGLVSSGEHDWSVYIDLHTGGRVVISDDKVELFDGERLENRISLKVRAFA